MKIADKNKKDFVWWGLRVSFGLLILSLMYLSLFYFLGILLYMIILSGFFLLLFVVSFLSSFVFSIINLIKKKNKVLPLISLVISAVILILGVYFLISILNIGFNSAKYENNPPQFEINQKEFTDEEILNAAYYFEIPEGDPFGEEIRYDELAWKGLNRTFSNFYNEGISDDEIDLNRNFGFVKELRNCRNNRDEALELSKEVYESDKEIIEERETEKFFEFKRMAWGYDKPQHYLPTFNMHRIFKCSYLNISRDDYTFTEENFPSRDGKFPVGEDIVIGTFNQRPITTENVKELIEYLWYVENIRDFESWNVNVLSSFSEDEGIRIKHTMYKIYETMEQASSLKYCDTFTLYKFEYFVDKNSGEITAPTSIGEPIKSVYGKCIPSFMIFGAQ